MWAPAPYYKGRKFCPNPIVEYGIPKYADSVANPKVVGTPDWQKFWEEQIYYIKNGYTTGGVFLPGRFYYFMNFRKLPTVLGPIYPQMCDLHLELCNVIDYVKSSDDLSGIIIPKGRRKGISEVVSTVIDHGYRFSNGYKAGVAAGLDDYVQDFMAKWRYADSLIVPELRVNKLLDNNDEVIAGWEEKIDGSFIESGTRNTIYARTMFNNPNLFKGLYLNDIVAEEGGEFKKLKAFHTASEACTKFGKMKIGKFYIFGTGGKFSDSKDFKELWDQADVYKLVRFFISGTRFYFPFYGGATKDEKLVQEIPNLILPGDRSMYELNGVEDLAAAEADIKEELKRLAKAGDPKKYIEFKQEHPFKIGDVFKNTTVNCFDTDKLASQDEVISQLAAPKYIKYRLEWQKDQNGMIKMPYKVNAIPLKTGESEDECVYILASEPPRIVSHKNLYVAGLDSYDQDTSKTSKSLGAMCVLIRDNHIPNALKKVPVAVIRTRPPRKEKFYELCLKLAVFYDLKDNCLIDVRCPAIIEYWKQRSGERYLAKRPAKFESANSEQGHDYGVSLNNYSRPLMVSLMQTNIFDRSTDLWFNSNLETGPNLITELQNFDEVAIGSDNDLADAYGMALMQDVSCDVRVREVDQDNTIDKDWVLPSFNQPSLLGSADDFEGENDETEDNISLFR